MADPDTRPIVGPTFLDELAAAGLGHLEVSISGKRLNISPDIQGADLAALKAVLAKHDPTKKKIVMVPFNVFADRLETEGLWDKLVDSAIVPGKPIDAKGGLFLRWSLKRNAVRSDNAAVRQWLTDAGAKADQLDRIFAPPADD